MHHDTNTNNTTRKDVLRNPGGSNSLVGEGLSIYFPRWMFGEWQVEQRFTGFSTPLGAKFVSPDIIAVRPHPRGTWFLSTTANNTSTIRCNYRGVLARKLAEHNVFFLSMCCVFCLMGLHAHPVNNAALCSSRKTRWKRPIAGSACHPLMAHTQDAQAPPDQGGLGNEVSYSLRFYSTLPDTISNNLRVALGLLPQDTVIADRCDVHSNDINWSCINQ